MKQKKWMKLLLFVLVFSVIVIGCQSLGGLDIEKALLSNFKTESFEGKSTISFELIWDEGAFEEAADGLASDELVFINLLNKLTLELDQIKLVDQDTMSLQGTLQLYKGDIPFHITITETELAFLFAGAERPIIIELEEELTAVPDDYTEILTDVSEIVGGYLLGHISNPQNIKVSSGPEMIHDERMLLHKLSVELTSDELLRMIKQMLVSIAADEDGLKELLGQLYDLLIPIILELDEQTIELLGLEDMMPFVRNLSKHNVINFLVGTLQEQLAPIIEEFDEVFEQFPEELAKISLNMFFDNSLMLRKQEMEFIIMPGLEEFLGVQGVKITASTEIWNINGEVTINELDTTDAYAVDDDTKPAHFLKQLDQDSLLYELLYDDLKITHQELYMFVDSVSEPGIFKDPYIVNGTTLVPVRYVSESLNADVYWEQSTKQVTIIDILTETEIVLTVGSNIAYVDGEEHELLAAVELHDGTSYVPVRFIVESLGGEVDWDDELRLVTIIKD